MMQSFKIHYMKGIDYTKIYMQSYELGSTCNRRIKNSIPLAQSKVYLYSNTPVEPVLVCTLNTLDKQCCFLCFQEGMKILHSRVLITSVSISS